jgi:hypothetical protein
MANDFRSFNLNLEAFAHKIKLAPATITKRVAFELFGRIVEKTPVDTGRARASWNISIGEPDRSVAPEGQQPAMNRVSAEAKARTALATLTERGVLGDTVYITNNLPYIVALEDGHSPQSAPKVMVALSIEEVNLKMDQLIAEGLKDAGL